MDRIMNFLSDNGVSHSSYAQIPLLNYVFCFIFGVKWMLGAHHFRRILLILSVSTCINTPGWSVVRDPAERTWREEA